MKSLKCSIMVVALSAAIVGAGVQPASAAKAPLLFGTTGACNNVVRGGPCTQTSMLVQLDPSTGALIREIGPVGFTVNGLAWDRHSKRLYASTAIGDVVFHGLITIDPDTGAGTPVNPSVTNFGLSGPDSPIHSITIDSRGKMVGWYDETPPPVGVTDTFVQIDKRTGVATEFVNTGINTSQNGLSFDNDDRLWNIDASRIVGSGTSLTQTAYRLDASNGHALRSVQLSPPLDAALGDFNPSNGRYYGLNFVASFPQFPTLIEVVDVRTGTVSTLGQTIDGLHTLAFAKKVK
jgi:hypothetical protein